MRRRHDGQVDAIWRRIRHSTKGGDDRRSEIMSSNLKIRQLQLRNWKNFADIEVSLQDRVFLVGPNASGKSNFLDVFRFLRDIVATGGGFQEAISRRHGVSAIRCLAARKRPDIEIRVDLQDEKEGSRWEYEIVFYQDTQRRPLLRKERVSHNGTVLLERPDKQDKEDLECLRQTHLEQVNVNKPFRVLTRFFKAVRYLHIVPQLVRDPDRSVGRSDDPFGGDFLEQIAKTPKRTSEARLKRIQNALQVAVPQLEEIELQRDDRGTPHLRSKYRHWRPQRVWQMEKQFSDGTLRLIGLLWAIMETKGLLLLEEPELSLHPGIVRVLPQLLARAQRKTDRQIFLGTHSPELLRDEGIGLDEALLIIPKTNGAQVTLAMSLEDACALLEGGLSLADVVIPNTQPRSAEQLTDF